ncbi:MAG TPA: formyltetrahydrofolate deformylase [Baekduia sp.]|nr:formyltetrahydrofolate deformylase [Baekduia sp.]
MSQIQTAPAVAAPAPSAPPQDIGRLLVRCQDGPGIVAAIASFLAGLGANIIASDQHSTDPQGGTFFLRATFHLAGLRAGRDAIAAAFAAEVADRFGMHWKLALAADRKRVAIMVSRYDHCLMDLLWRARRGELHVDVPLVISNHPDLEEAVTAFGVDYIHIPVSREGKAQAESRQLDLLKAATCDLVVMARYMQILSAHFLREVACPVINIHHSFLPAFAGAGPYERAKERGVKLIGATAHYATEDLDEGPIIEQDVIRVSHRHSAADLIRLGSDVERVVLARAVGWHCEDRIVRDGSTTVVF